MTKKTKITIGILIAVIALTAIVVGGYFIIRNMFHTNIEHPFSGNGSDHIVYFDSQGGSDVASQSVRDGNPVLRPDTPLKEGYFLTGWFENADLSKEWNFDTDRVYSDMTLYAGWEKEQEELPPTESLLYKLNENSNEYIVTGVGEETIVVIPDEYNGLPVTTIQGQYGTGAFARKAITSIILPDSIVTIGSNTFNNCSSLVNVVIGKSSNLTSIGNNAFSGCVALQSVYIPSGVTSIGDSAFNNDASINFTVAQENAVYRSENGHLIETATQTLIRGGQNVNVPKGVTSIAQAAFRRSALEKIVIPSSVTAIGNYFIADSGITVIEYRGTEEQWNAIEKTKSWNFGKKDVTITFSGDTLKILIAYFSGSGNTERVAGYIAEATGGTLFELVPETPYTSADLSWTTSGSRVNREHDDESLRDIPLVTTTPDNFAEYDVVFIGYPIWWGIAAWPVNNFVKNNNFDGKTIIPFATSASSGMGQSGALLRDMAGTGNWLDGQRFSSGASKSTVENWIIGLNLAA